MLSPCRLSGVTRTAYIHDKGADPREPAPVRIAVARDQDAGRCFAKSISELEGPGPNIRPFLFDHAGLAYNGSIMLRARCLRLLGRRINHSPRCPSVELR